MDIKNILVSVIVSASMIASMNHMHRRSFISLEHKIEQIENNQHDISKFSRDLKNLKEDMYCFKEISKAFQEEHSITCELIKELTKKSK